MSIYGKLGVINTNLMANAAYQGMESTNKLLSVHQNRIATLKKVNGSEDDPAGYIMASNMKLEMDGMDVSGDNIGNAQNMINIANNGASSIKDLLTEMRKKALEASDGSKSTSQRTAIQSQVSQYLSEIQDTVNQTTWNGQVLLDGTASFNFQTGANDGDVTNLNIGLNFGLGLQASELAAGLTADDVYFGENSVADDGVPTVTSSDDVIDADWTMEFTGSDTYKVSYTDTDGITHNYDEEYSVSEGEQFAGHGIDLTGFGKGEESLHEFAEGDIITFSTEASVANNLYGLNKTVTGTYSDSLSDMVDASGVVGDADLLTTQSKPGDLIEYEAKVTAGADLGAGGTATLQIRTRAYTDGEWGDWVTSATTQDVATATNVATFAGADHHATGLEITFDGAADVLAVDDVFKGTIQIAKAGGVTEDGVNVDGLTGTGGIDLTTENGAKASLNKLDAALDAVTNELGTMGAVSKRLDMKSSLLEKKKTQIGAAVSRIEDADLIAEQLEVAKLQILQQANLSLMSQAQQAPRIVLGIMGLG